MLEYDQGRPASHGDPAAVTTRVNGDTSVPHDYHDGIPFEPSRKLVSEFSTTSVVFGPTSGTCSGTNSNGPGYCSESGGGATLNPTREPLKPARYQEVVVSGYCDSWFLHLKHHAHVHVSHRRLLLLPLRVIQV